MKDKERVNEWKEKRNNGRTKDRKIGRMEECYNGRMDERMRQVDAVPLTPLAAQITWILSSSRWHCCTAPNKVPAMMPTKKVTSKKKKKEKKKKRKDNEIKATERGKGTNCYVQVEFRMNLNQPMFIPWTNFGGTERRNVHIVCEPVFSYEESAQVKIRKHG